MRNVRGWAWLRILSRGRFWDQHCWIFHFFSHFLSYPTFPILKIFVAKKRLGKQVPAATNARTAIEELLDLIFSALFMSFQVLSLQWKESRQFVLSRNSCNVWRNKNAGLFEKFIAEMFLKYEESHRNIMLFVYLLLCITTLCQLH